MASSGAVVAIVVVAVIVWLLVRRFPKTTRRWFGRIELSRQVIWGLFILGFAWVLLSSGVTSLVLVGAIVFGYAILYIMLEEPHEAVKDALGG